MKIFEHLDDSITLSGDEAILFDSVRALARDKIAPRAAAYDQSGDFPWDNVADINALGLNAMFVPEAYDGAALSYTAYLRCVREISKACAATGVIWATNFHAMKPVIDFGDEAQKRRILPKIVQGALASLCITEPDAGSDATAMRTRFTPDGDSIVVDGGKLFISNGGASDFYLVFGKWSEIDDARGAMSAVVIDKDTPGFSAGAKEDKMGVRASATTSLTFDGCRIPRENLLGAPGDGLRILLSSLNKSRPSVAAHALGIARAAFEDAVAYINQRKQSGGPIIGFQGVQFMLADMATDLAMCESWLWHVGRMVDSGAPDFSAEASMLKMRAADVAMRIATDAVQLHGGYGYIKEYRVERLMRDAKICQIWEGANQIHRQYIGRTFIEK
ncbi:MAG: acyl-CoA dehydrogenase [Rhodospirillaceae bacterium]|jgi:acyl-CoA dehydrogenase|nr:acyl-CoA dehydrogenase [Rhodospirillaceae bacterium]MBT5809502.1 acyl-CoA dehydrogenase [Rhodospirillaceae bacterium]